MRSVRGSLFKDYVRMMRGHGGVDWSKHVQKDDEPFLEQTIDDDAWYPMATFERFGIAILQEVAANQMIAVRMWGRFQVDAIRKLHPSMVAVGDPCTSFTAFQKLRSSFFDFSALDVKELDEDHVRVEVRYHMSPMAEEAACIQTMGFLERVVELAGGQNIVADFVERSWAGDERTTIDVSWKLTD